jgi:serine phosphatase RsbU (regulator of sigma subunit)
MRTRALFYFILGVLILAALAVLDLVAHSYTALGGPVFELLRAGIQAIAMLWLARGAELLFFRLPAIARPEELTRATSWPVKLVQRFTVVLAISDLLSLAPNLFRLSLNKNYSPTTFTSVISIDVLGLLWLLMLVAQGLSFWQLLFVRQSTRTARRRFIGWAMAAAGFSLFSFWVDERVIPASPMTSIVMAVFAILVALAAILLGYRLPWLPHIDREGKRKLLIFGVLNVALACLGVILYAGNVVNADVLFEHYSLVWQTIAVVLFVTLAIYFVLVFFSTLFSLSSTELVERKSAEVKSLAKLTRFSSDVLSSELLLDLPKLAEQITALACEATESDCAWLELRTNAFGSLGETSEEVIRSYVGIGEQAAERIMSTAEGFPEAGRQIQSPRSELEATRKPFVLRRRIGVRQYLAPTAEQARENKELHSAVAVPLIRKHEVRGGLYVAKHREDGFDDDDLTVLTAFSDVASLALETARLLQDSIEKQKFDGELRAARIMQKSLLPERFPYIEGFDLYAVSIPAYDVGGDYYDFSSLWDGSPMLAIGDVSGKGIGASLYMAETKGVVQALAPIMTNMQELLEGTNSALMRNSPQQSSLRRSFVTLGLVAFQKGKLRYCRAGHTPLLVVRADGTHEFLQPRGMAVGLMKQGLFTHALEEVVLETRPGDTYVLFSDGITDARDPDGNELGYQRLAQYVLTARTASARETTLDILEGVSDFTQSGSFGDDATLVVIRRNS